MNKSRDWLDDLKNKTNQFGDDKFNETLAIECACAAWSLCDWVFSEHGQQLGYQKLYDLQNDFKSQCTELSFMQDICTERKHSKISRYTPSIDKAELHEGSFSSGYSRGYDVSGLKITLSSGTKVWFDDALNNVVQFWDGYYKNNNL